MPNRPIDQALFDEVAREMCDRLKAVMPVHGVSLSLLGAAIGTEDADPTTVQIFSSAIGIDRAKILTPNPTVYEQALGH